MKVKLWTRNYTLCILATVFGCVGGVASGFALSLLVFDETGSTFASALVIAIRIIPGFVIPLVASPLLDRFPRLPFVIFGDALNGIIYGLMGVYLLLRPFSYSGYLVLSLLLSALGTVDSMAFNALYPNLIPNGAEQKGYTVSSIVYSTVTVVMTPLSALLYDSIGVASMLFIQCALSLLAAGVESFIRFKEPKRLENSRFSLKMWCGDLRDAFQYLRKEKGIAGIFGYVAVSNGVATGFSPILLAFFRTAPGMTVAMYSLFSVAEFGGRTLGGLFSYRVRLPEKKRFPFVCMVYLIYDLMDILLLWLPYPGMLLNRALCGCLGMNSAAMREAAVQRTN